LFSASCYLHSPSTASGAIDMDVLRPAAAACCDIRLNFSTAWFTATDECRKGLETCINAVGGHCEHLLWHCLPDIPVATHHNRFFSEPPTTTYNWLSSEPPTFERMQQTFSFAVHKWVWWHFRVRWASGLQFVFFWDNIDSQNCVWIILLKLESDIFGYPNVKWLHLTCEMDKSVTFHVKFSQDLTCQKIIKIG